MAIVLDAMGGDLAPQAIVAGAVQATRSSTLPIILVGQHDVLEAELRKHDTADLPLTIRHAPDVITMHDHATAVRQRPQSSIRVACDLVKGGEGKGTSKRRSQWSDDGSGAHGVRTHCRY